MKMLRLGTDVFDLATEANENVTKHGRNIDQKEDVKLMITNERVGLAVDIEDR